MGGMQPGDKLTAQNLNDNYMCRTDDTDSTGRIKTDRYFVDGKASETAAAAQALVASTGVIEITGVTGDAASLDADPTQGFEDGQKVTIVNNGTGDYTLNFLTPTVVIPAGQSYEVVRCNGAWVGIAASPESNPFIQKAAVYAATGGQSIPDALTTDILFNVDELTDTHVTKSAGNNIFTVNEAGLYDISAALRFTSAEIAGANFERIGIRINGVQVRFSAGGVNLTAGSKTSFYPVFAEHIQRLAVGDTIAIDVFQSISSNVSRAFIPDSRYTYVNIQKVAF